MLAVASNPDVQFHARKANARTRDDSVEGLDMLVATATVRGRSSTACD